MADSLTLRVITPERIVLDLGAESVKFPGVDGSMGVLARHAPMVAALGTGELQYRTGGRSESMFVAGGFAEVRQNTVRVVTEASEPVSAIDVERAERAAERARERLRMVTKKDAAMAVDALRAEAALRRAIMRLNVARKRR